MHRPLTALIGILFVSLNGCGGGNGALGPCPKGSFCDSGAPTLQVSTQAIIPTVLMTSTSFTSTVTGGITTATVTGGPAGTTNDGIFTLANPNPGATLVGAVATLPSSILLASGIPALTMTSSSLGTSVGLASADFGRWAITNALATPLPTNSVLTYIMYAGGTLLTTTMPTTGTATYTGSMTGVVANTPIGGSDNLTGVVTLNINFAAGTISGSISSIITAAGVSTIQTYASYAAGQSLPLTFGDITIASGAITGSSFSTTGTTPSVVGPTIKTVTGSFYGLAATEVAGTFTISVPSPGTGMTLVGSFGAK